MGRLQPFEKLLSVLVLLIQRRRFLRVDESHIVLALGFVDLGEPEMGRSILAVPQYDMELGSGLVELTALSVHLGKL